MKPQPHMKPRHQRPNSADYKTKLTQIIIARVNKVSDIESETYTLMATCQARHTTHAVILTKPEEYTQTKPLNCLWNPGTESTETVPILYGTKRACKKKPGILIRAKTLYGILQENCWDTMIFNATKEAQP